MASANNFRDAIIECLRAHSGGPLSTRDMTAWVQSPYPRRWKDVATPLADLTIGGNTSSPYRDTHKCLIRVRRGVYRLADAYLSRRQRPDDEAASAPLAERAAGPSVPVHQTQAGEPAGFWIPGIPATFATAAEKVWREALDWAIPQVPGGRTFTGVELAFSVEGDLRGGQPYDLDNLCEPVFSALVNRKRWFDGRRQNIQWWLATRTLASPIGCRLRLAATPLDRAPRGKPLFSGIYRGEFPRGASDTRIADWLRAAGISAPRHRSRFAVSLEFGSAAINLGDIATGPVKSVIDNLFPIVGGVMQAPEDWRIARLRVHKGVSELESDAVRITLRTPE